jgi:putative transposase
MLKAFRYRIYPTIEQQKELNKIFGSVRFVYNLALETRLTAYSGSKKFLSLHEITKQLPELKEECKWLKKVNSQSLQMALRNQEIAWNKFFREGAGFPKFRKKTGTQTFQCPQNVKIDFEKCLLHLPKFNGALKIILHRKFKGKVKTVTISKTTTNKYFASVLVDNNKELPKKKPIKENTAIGIDLNLKETAVCSDGVRFENPKYLKHSIGRLKVLQRRLSKKKKGSNRYKRYHRTIALRHEKISNQRKDFLHKLSNQLVNNHDTLVFETLKVQNMMANHKLAGAISDAGWNMLIGFCKYKAEWNGKNVIQIGTFEPSTKLCSHCGYMNHSLTLADREWICPKCGTKHDRDKNSAINIKSFGLNKIFTAGMRGEDAETPAIVRSVKRQSSNNVLCATHT